MITPTLITNILFCTVLMKAPPQPTVMIPGARDSPCPRSGERRSIARRGGLAEISLDDLSHSEWCRCDLPVTIVIVDFCRSDDQVVSRRNRYGKWSIAGVAGLMNLSCGDRALGSCGTSGPRRPCRSHRSRRSRYTCRSGDSLNPLNTLRPHGPGLVEEEQHMLRTRAVLLRIGRAESGTSSPMSGRSRRR